jgi:hypothetical protein
MVELVTRMMDLKKQQARAPKKQSPISRQLLDQKLAITDQQIDALVHELYGPTEDEIRIVGGGERDDSQNNMGSVPNFYEFLEEEEWSE